MDITERISRIEEYFINMRVDKDEDAILVLVKFPASWQISNQKEILNKYKVQIGDGGNGIFFGTERENGAEVVFDAIEFVIDFNKTLQEKQTLLKEKSEELVKLFTEEPLDRLKNLRFVIDTEEKAEKEDERLKETEKVEEKVPEVEVKKEKESEKKQRGSKKNNDDSSLMSFAKEMVSE